MEKHLSQSTKLEMKYLADEAFRNQTNEKIQNYRTLEQESFYTDLSEISQDLFVCYSGGSHPIYFYFGCLQPKKNKFRKLLLFFIRYFRPIPLKEYTFVFINTLAASDAYANFKQVFLNLSFQHFLHLRQFIFFKPTYYQRATDYISFNSFANYLKNLTVNFYSAEEMCQHLNINVQNFIDIIPEQITKIQFPKLKPRKLGLEEQRINFQGQLMDETERTLKKQFQNTMKSMLIVKPGQEKFLLQDYENGNQNVPIMLQMLVKYFDRHPEGLQLQGLFRKSVSIDQQNETLGELINQNYDCLLSIANPHIAANLIKRFFSNLKVPVFPYTQFETLMHDQGIANKLQHIRNTVSSLPPCNYRSLFYLIKFLKTKVVPLKQINKMTSQNIAICFAPCLLRAQKPSMSDIVFASKCAMVTKTVIDSFQEVFVREEEEYRLGEIEDDQGDEGEGEGEGGEGCGQVRIGGEREGDVRKEIVGEEEKEHEEDLRKQGHDADVNIHVKEEIKQNNIDENQDQASQQQTYDIQENKQEQDVFLNLNKMDVDNHRISYRHSYNNANFDPQEDINNLVFENDENDTFSQKHQKQNPHENKQQIEERIDKYDQNIALNIQKAQILENYTIINDDTQQFACFPQEYINQPLKTQKSPQQHQIDPSKSIFQQLKNSQISQNLPKDNQISLDLSQKPQIGHNSQRDSELSFPQSDHNDGDSDQNIIFLQSTLKSSGDPSSKYQVQCEDPCQIVHSKICVHGERGDGNQGENIALQNMNKYSKIKSQCSKEKEEADGAFQTMDGGDPQVHRFNIV